MNIRMLNKIDPIVHEILKDYHVSQDCEDPVGILIRSAKIHDMEFPESLLAIARAGAGVNNIPIERCAQEGIVVFNTPGANANAVKELVLASIMMTSRNLCEAIEWCKSLCGNPDAAALIEAGKNQFVGPELKGKTMGVIGLGDIGVMVANEAYAIGMNVIGFDPFISVDHAWKLSRAIEHASSLDYLIRESDFITLHVPLTDETRGFFGEKQLAACKPTAMLLNFSRADVVDTTAVLKALEEDRLAKYIVDFPTPEVICKKNVVAIPHLGASTPEAEENCARMAAKQLKDYIENGNIVNSVNLPNCDMPRSGAMRICLLHKNIPNMVGRISAAVAKRNANITNMMNRSRNNYAYTMLDLDEDINNHLYDDLCSIEGMIRTRILKNK
ncbi:MAG: phosphoglycerate dehydrogenase [Christensenellales bacterium]|jgi:D-3-phosphoglycerate dehydrogenase